MPKASVIIPCFNQGQYIDEAVDSVLDQTFQDFEIIIINDGSTDEFTNSLLKKYDKPKTRVISTANYGLAAARNNGIEAATGEYILPLDSDDKIGEVYLEKAVKVLDNNTDIGIVYCLAEYFGGKQGKWEMPEYSLKKILVDNVIFCSAFFRKKEWMEAGGYKSNMKHGLEDWDFWLSLIELGKKVYRIPEVLFYYRVTESSMIRSMTDEQKMSLLYQVFHNHKKIYSDNVECLFEGYIEYRKAFTTAFNQLTRIQDSLLYRMGKFTMSPIKKYLHLIKKKV